MAALAGGDVAKLRALSAVPYKDQAQWFLNAFWAGETGPCFSANEDKAEEIWAIVNKAVTLDKKKGEEGCELDEWEAHQLLESFGCTLTVEKMRAVLKDIDLDFNKMMSLTEYFIFKFEVDWKVLVNAPQGEDSDQVVEARRLVEAAQAALANVQATADKAKEEEEAAKAAAQKAQDEAKNAEEEEAQAVVAEGVAKQAEEDAAKAKEVAEAALAELTAQETAFHDKVRSCGGYAFVTPWQLCTRFAHRIAIPLATCASTLPTSAISSHPATCCLSPRDVLPPPPPPHTQTHTNTHTHTRILLQQPQPLSLAYPMLSPYPFR
jgi:hypothetical protein